MRHRDDSVLRARGIAAKNRQDEWELSTLWGGARPAALVHSPLPFPRHVVERNRDAAEIPLRVARKLWRGQHPAGYPSPSRGRAHRGIAKSGARASGATRKM